MIKTNSLNIGDLKKAFDDQTVIHSLQERIDIARKNKERPFEDFSDVEMIQWFLHKKVHLDRKHDHVSKTTYEYKRELLLFIRHIMTHAAEIGISFDEIVEGSLFKSLEEKHIRLYHEWLFERSPYVVKNEKKYSAATIQRKTVILKSFLFSLFDSGYITEPIHNGLYKTTVTTDDRPDRDLGPSEVKQLLDYFKGIEHYTMFAAIHVLATTGLRNEEFCRLKVKDVYYSSIQGFYYLDVLGKGNKRRQIPLKDKVVDSINLFRRVREQKEIAYSNEEETLFTTNTGKAYSPPYLAQFMSDKIKKSNLPFLAHHSKPITPHHFRHSFAIISFLNDVDIYTISRALGHEKVDTTQIYLQKTMDMKAHAIHSWNNEELKDYI